MKCQYCQGACIKKGRYKNIQKYRCITCGKYQREIYSVRRNSSDTEQKIQVLNNEGVGISSMSRILQIPKSSVQMLVIRAASKVVVPLYNDSGQEYEVDELYTYIRNKSDGCYIIYAINRKTGQVIDYATGRRNKENISHLIERLLSLSPGRIYTDRLVTYRSLSALNMMVAVRLLDTRQCRMAFE